MMHCKCLLLTQSGHRATAVVVWLICWISHPFVLTSQLAPLQCQAPRGATENTAASPLDEKRVSSGGVNGIKIPMSLAFCR
jgi:hypothetical protein